MGFSSPKIKIKVPPKNEVQQKDTSCFNHLNQKQKDVALQLFEAGYDRNIIISAFLVDSSLRYKGSRKEATEKNKSLVQKIFRKNSQKNVKKKVETTFEYEIVD